MNQQVTKLDIITSKLTKWIGSTSSLVIHTIIFLGTLTSPLFGFSVDHMLLVLTTIVSLEAIYLAIFIQYTVNRHSETLKEVAEDVEEVTKNVEEISEDVEEISEDVEDISEDVEEISTGGQLKIESSGIDDYARIENTLKQLQSEIDSLRARQR